MQSFPGRQIAQEGAGYGYDFVVTTEVWASALNRRCNTPVIKDNENRNKIRLRWQAGKVMCTGRLIMAASALGPTTNALAPVIAEGAGGAALQGVSAFGRALAAVAPEAVNKTLTSLPAAVANSALGQHIATACSVLAPYMPSAGTCLLCGALPVAGAVLFPLVVEGVRYLWNERKADAHNTKYNPSELAAALKCQRIEKDLVENAEKDSAVYNKLVSRRDYYAQLKDRSIKPSKVEIGVFGVTAALSAAAAAPGVIAAIAAGTVTGLGALVCVPQVLGVTLLGGALAMGAACGYRFVAKCLYKRKVRKLDAVIAEKGEKVAVNGAYNEKLNEIKRLSADADALQSDLRIARKEMQVMHKSLQEREAQLHKLAGIARALQEENARLKTAQAGNSGKGEGEVKAEPSSFASFPATPDASSAFASFPVSFDTLPGATGDQSAGETPSSKETTVSAAGTQAEETPAGGILPAFVSEIAEGVVDFITAPFGMDDDEEDDGEE